MFRRNKPEPAPKTTVTEVASATIFTQPCDDASGCKILAFLDNHVQWTVPNIGRVHQYYCQAHWETRQARKAKKGVPAVVDKKGI